MPKHYKKSPITQATCTFVFDQESTNDLTIPGVMYGRLRGSYPVSRRVDISQISIPATETKPGQQLLIQGMAQFSSETGQDVVLVGPRVLIVSRLAPYETWQRFLPKIQEAFAVHQSAVGPKRIENISLAYANRLDIPNPPIRLEDFLEFYPYLGANLRQVLGPFVVNVQIPYANQTDVLRLHLQPLAAPNPNIASLLLAIDQSSVELRSPSWDVVGPWLELAHTRADETFEGCIKDTLRILFEVNKEC